MVREARKDEEKYAGVAELMSVIANATHTINVTLFQRLFLSLAKTCIEVFQQ